LTNTDDLGPKERLAEYRSYEEEAPVDAWLGLHHRHRSYINRDTNCNAAVYRARIVFDCRMTNDPPTINKESTNENNTDVDRCADARRLRINGKPCS
jgi:hypothetical protein